MNDSLGSIEMAITEMEKIQARLGRIQLNLLRILVDDQVNEWDEIVQSVMIRLETIQRGIGEVQVDLVGHFSFGTHSSMQNMPVMETVVQEQTQNGEKGEDSTHMPAMDDPQALSMQTQTFLDPKSWLTTKGIEINHLREGSGIDAAADRAADFLGDNFEVLEPFYSYLKKRLNGSRGQWFPIRDLPKSSLETIIRFGNMLKSSSFLAEFKYIGKNRVLLVNPQGDGRVKNFLTGDWFERYTLHLVERAFLEVIGTWNPAQVLHGAKVVLPDHGDAEFDLLVGAPNKNVLWIECKTGEFQNYVTRLKQLNQRFLRLPKEQAVLVLLDPIHEDDKASASALTGMNVIHLTELTAWLKEAIKTTII